MFTRQMRARAACVSPYERVGKSPRRRIPTGEERYRCTTPEPADLGGYDMVDRRTQDVATTTCAARFEVRHTQFLDQEGRPLGELPPCASERETLRALYRHMVLTRVFDAKAVALQRTGQLGTYPSTLGQEAVSTAMAAAMAADDVLLPTYRETAAQLWRGVSMTEILLYWGGDERGMAFRAQPEDFPTSVPIASHAPQAVGVAFAFRRRRQARVAVCALGDGATSKGDFYEALNCAAVWDLPVVFVVNNNQWAISVPRSRQSRAETLAQKAIAAGFEGEQVDGNDAIAMYARMGDALEHARSGGGPRLIEALTYRISDHTTSDDAARYRSREEVEHAAQRDPVMRLREFMRSREFWSDADEHALLEDCSTRVEQAVSEYLATPSPAPETIFDFLFETLPNTLRSQREQLLTRTATDE
jgi:2-oxoisovalerate dehydrogenase E1 component alpha subunit